MPSETAGAAGTPGQRAQPTFLSDHLANERTYLAYLRTAVSLMSFGIAINRFSYFLAQSTGRPETPHPASGLLGSERLGIGMVVIGMALLVWAAVQYNHVFRQIERRNFRPRPGSIMILTALVLASGASGVPGCSSADGSRQETACMSSVEEIASRMWENLIARPSGPYGFRFLLQPAMGVMFAIRDGVKDARSGRSPYFWTILSNKTQRGGRLREGFRAVWKIIALALVLDAIYQFSELGTFHPGEATIVATLLAIFPYLLARGPVTRIIRWWRGRAG